MKRGQEFVLTVASNIIMECLNLSIQIIDLNLRLRGRGIFIRNDALARDNPIETKINPDTCQVVLSTRGW